MAIKLGIEIIKFLNAARNLVKNKAMSKEGILRFAKQQFGEVPALLKKQIDDLFKAKPKTQKKGDVVPIKEGEGIPAILTKKQKEGLKDFIKKADEKQVEDLSSKILKKRTEDIAKGDVTGETSDLMTKIESDLEKVKETSKKLKETTEGLTGSPFDDFQNYVLGGGRARDPRRGVVRAAAREILNKNKVNIGREDPIEVFRKMYGEDGLEAIDAVSDGLLDAQSYGEMNTILRDNKLFDIVPKKTYGYDQSVVSAEKIRKAKELEAKNKQILDTFDPKDRDPNADGGIAGTLRLNRTGYVVGSGPKVINLIAKHGPEFKKFVDMLFIKASNTIRQGKGIFKNLDESQRIKQHDNLTQKVNTFQKEGTLEGMEQYFGIDAVKAFEEAQATVQKQTLKNWSPGTDRLPNADGGLIDILKL